VPSKSLDGISGKVPAKRFHGIFGKGPAKRFRGIFKKCRQKDSTAQTKSAGKTLNRHKLNCLK
jgi:hypothetical protein